MPLKFGLNPSSKHSTDALKSKLDPRKTVFQEDGDSDGDEPPTLGAQKSSTKPPVQEITSFDGDDIPKSIVGPEVSSKTERRDIKNAPRPKSKPKQKVGDDQIGPSLSALHTQNRIASAATELDPSIYDYDAAYDALSSKKKAAAKAKAAEAAERKPQYVNSLVAAAEQRQRDFERAKDRQLQRERENEGDEFKDKDMFVTEAYKAQQEEAKKAEEEEAKEAEKEEKRRKQGVGLNKFYRDTLEHGEKRHQELVEAANRPKDDKQEGDAEEQEPEEKTETALADELKAKGIQVETNAEGEITDKRDLLSAGLNVAPKPKTQDTSKPSQDSRTSKNVIQNTTRMSNDSKRAMRERQSRMMEEQLEQAAKRAADDEVEEREKLEKASKSRKTQGDISSAKERYLQRKREAEAAKARGE